MNAFLFKFRHVWFSKGYFQSRKINLSEFWNQIRNQRKNFNFSALTSSSSGQRKASIKILRWDSNSPQKFNSKVLFEFNPKSLGTLHFLNGVKSEKMVLILWPKAILAKKDYTRTRRSNLESTKKLAEKPNISCFLPVCKKSLDELK